MGTADDLLRQRDEWDQAFRRYQHTTWHPDSVTEEERSQATTRLVKIASVLLRGYAERSSNREHWNYPGYYGNPLGFPLVAEATTQQHTYEFGLEANNFSLQTLLCAPWTIKFAGMEFWRHLVDLDRIGVLTFNANNGPTIPPENKAFRPLLKRGTNPIYRLIRDLVLTESEGPEIEDSQVGTDFGWLKGTWAVRTITWEDLLTKGTEAFRHLYQANALNWRHDSRSDRAIRARLERHRATAREPGTDNAPLH